jgi:hypothetical protein
MLNVVVPSVIMRNVIVPLPGHSQIRKLHMGVVAWHRGYCTALHSDNCDISLHSDMAG